MHAVMGGSESCVKLLLPHADARAMDPLGWTALHWAVEAVKAGEPRPSNLVELLIPASDAKAVDAEGWSALHRAAWRGLDREVELLLPHGDPAMEDKEGRSPAALARLRGHEALASAIEECAANRERADIASHLATGRAAGGGPAQPTRPSPPRSL
jgi:ankyrin repeat protein